MTKSEMRDELERLRGELAYERQKLSKLEAGAPKKESGPRGWIPVGDRDMLALSFKQFLRAVDQKIHTVEDVEAARKILEPFSWDYFRARGLIS